jgi:hypothetical protein
MSEEKEIWKPIPDEEFEDLYEISNLGNYRNKLTLQILKPYKAGKYLMASLSKPGRKMQRYLIHRLVACAFVEDPENNADNDVVNHVDGDKMNNKAENLEWINASKNAKHSREILNQRKTTKKVIRIDNDGNEVIYEGIAIAARENNLRRQYITECARGKRESIGGFKWKYSNQAHNFHAVDLSSMEEIDGFEGYYIDREGKIYGVSKSQFLTYNMSDGYPKVMLYKNRKPSSFYVHVLVAKTFIPNPENKPVVNHIDHNKINCNVDNLEWVTHSENSNKYYEMKRNSSILN